MHKVIAELLEAGVAGAEGVALHCPLARFEVAANVAVVRVVLAVGSFVAEHEAVRGIALKQLPRVLGA